METMTCWKCGGDVVLTPGSGDELTLVDICVDGMPTAVRHAH